MMIRKILMSALVIVALTACQEEAATDESSTETPAAATPAAATAAAAAPVGNAGTTSEVTTVEWEGKVHDFGEIPQGTPVTHTFKVVNTGEEPLNISNVKASCGCTATDYTKEAIPPGGEGFVQARYNAAAAGVFNKSVTVTYNVANQRELLRLKGTVKAQ